ncbi:MAG TPA: DNA-3-methyladenine glycosylase I [Candidatus Dormibacteraeota bacterium]
MSDVVAGADGLTRCAWGVSTPEYQPYHDEEWGRPVGDDVLVLEKICLEGFQSGLAWITILRKREAFRRAFAGFAPEVVAQFGDGEVERLLGDPGIVRHRAKILAAIANARATLRLAEEGVSLAALVWSHEPVRGDAATSFNQLPPSTPESTALSADLRRRGFQFVGPTTAYAAMQALGVVNDHLAGCHFREVCAAERAAFTAPRL